MDNPFEVKNKSDYFFKNKTQDHTYSGNLKAENRVGEVIKKNKVESLSSNYQTASSSDYTFEQIRNHEIFKEQSKEIDFNKQGSESKKTLPSYKQSLEKVDVSIDEPTESVASSIIKAIIDILFWWIILSDD